MASQTSGGLLKFSTALDPELLRELDEVAADRMASRNLVIRDLLRRGLRDLRREQRLLKSLQDAGQDVA